MTNILAGKYRIHERIASGDEAITVLKGVPVN